MKKITLTFGLMLLLSACNGTTEENYEPEQSIQDIIQEAEPSLENSNNF